MEYNMVKYDCMDGIATITLSRPDKRNAFNMEMMGEMDAAFDRAAKDRSVKVILFTGEGKAFSAGLDFNWAAEMDLEKMPPMASTVRGRQVAYEESSLLTLVLKMQQCPKPVIAAVNGVALGGAVVLIAACDIRIAAEQAEFGLLQTKRGLIPDGGGTYLLPRILGLPRALELALTADVIDAHEAARIGLINRVVPHDELLASARDTANRIAANAPLAVAMTKAAMYKGLHEHDLASHMDYEVYIMSILFGTEDFREGMASLWEKRPPEFKGK